MSLFNQHWRLVGLAGGSGRGKKGEGEATTQAAATDPAGGKRGPGRPPAGAPPPHPPVAVTVDKRTPLLSPACLARLLDAITNDGLVGAAGAGADSHHTQLARNVQFQIFVFSAALRVLQAAQSCELASALAVGTAAAPAAEAKAVAQLLAPVQQDWQRLAGPLFRAAQTASGTPACCALCAVSPQSRPCF